MNPVSLQEFLTFQYGMDAAVSNLTRYMPSYKPFKSVLQHTVKKHCSCTDPLTHRSHRWTLYSLPRQLRVLLLLVSCKLHQCMCNLRVSSMSRKPRCSQLARACQFFLARCSCRCACDRVCCVDPSLTRESLFLASITSVLSLSVFPPASRR